MKRLLLLAAALIAGGGLGGLLWISYVRAYAIVHPARGAITYLPGSVGITDYETVSFLSADGLTLKGWYMPPQNGAVIIFVHGHAGNRQGLLDDAAILVKQGYGALLFDLRNNGESEGDVTTFGLQEANDVRSAVEFVLSQSGAAAPVQIALLGESMGGATALLAAAQIPEIRAVAVESAYASMEDNVKTGVEQLAGLPSFPFAPLILFWGQYEAGMDIRQVRPIDEIATLSPRPVLIMHGERDAIIPVENAHRLYAAAREPKELYLVPNGTHGHLLGEGGEAFAQRISDFFNRYLLGN